MRMSLLSWVLLCIGVLFGCTDQHNPTGDWKTFKAERENANRPTPRLTEDYKIPAKSTGEEEPGNPIDKKYASFCASCHGDNGGGDGPAGVAMKDAPPRNFITWNDPKITDEYIAKIIREGGVAVGKSALMAPWGGVLSEDEITAMVAKVRSFKK